MGTDNEKNRNDKSKRKLRTDLQRIDDICYEEGFLSDDVYHKCYLMFKDYRDSKFRNDYPLKADPSEEEIVKSKNTVRAKLLEVMSRPFAEAEKEQKELVKEVLSYAWFQEKLDYALEKIADFHKVGSIYRDILNATYFQAKSDELEDILAEVGISKSRYYDRLKEAITLFGIILWRYAKRREFEDMAKGIIPKRDIYPDRPGDVRPERRSKPRDEDAKTYEAEDEEEGEEDTENDDNSDEGAG